jgi:hypothetical protein
MPPHSAVPRADRLRRMPAADVIAVLAAHWRQLSKRQRDEYTHALLEHPDRVEIFDVVFRRAAMLSRTSRN